MQERRVIRLPNKARRPTLSIVVPCYDEAEVLGETVKHLQQFCGELRGMDAELIFVDDGSRDRTCELLKSCMQQDSRIKLIRFTRNFGHQIAVTAGIDAADGDAVVVLDADLQDPPEVIHQMIEKWQEGYDVVYGTRTERPGEPVLKLATSRWFYRILNRLSDVAIPLDAGDFRLMSRNVVDILRVMPERDRFIRGLVSWVGFKQISLQYKRAERYAGKSKYPFRKLFHLAVDGLLSFSIKPLELSVGLGMISASLSLVGIMYALVLRVFTNTWVEGWMAMMIAILFMGGVQLVSIGVLGEYVGRIYSEIKGRPLYIVQEYLGFENAGPTLSRSPMHHQSAPEQHREVREA